ncbi:MAG: hypothetical protein LC721_11850, partial [Actinobacteria bacterium]|nr:hypothetical protein [Actinomycetota bacterium]
TDATDPTTDVITRPNPGADGGESSHIIEKVGGKTVSVTHKVEVDGEIVHQHQRYIGYWTGEPRYFPPEWTGRPYVNYEPSDCNGG